jgi:BolA family transcriptional regulator, general stress-responsive regulator
MRGDAILNKAAARLTPVHVPCVANVHDQALTPYCQKRTADRSPRQYVQTETRSYRRHSTLSLCRGQTVTMTSAEARIREKLMIALNPIRLDVINDSEKHAGHRSSPGTGESHFSVLVVSEAFVGKSRVDRHRMVNEALSDDVGKRIHALALATFAPGEKLPS